MQISVEEAHRTALAALMRGGVPEENARTQLDVWMEAELRGHPSHGLLRLPRIVERIANDVANPTTKGKSNWKGKALLAVEGEGGLGPVVANTAIAQISARAVTTGIAAAAIRDSNHLGMLAVYAERVAEKGQIMLALTTSEALVHPWGGRFAMVGTNPIAIGVPAKPAPLVLDMATSKVSMGKVHDYANRGEALEPGWALDAKGDPTTDAAAARDGAIAPFGDAKGYALGLAFEVLVAGMTASALGRDVKGTLDSTVRCNKGDLFIVMEPSDAQTVENIGHYLNAIRECEPAHPDRPVQVPGDRARRSRKERAGKTLEIAEPVWQRICALAGEPNNHGGRG
ncbi:Ldh family oxidoreductase [Nitratireductor sp.]|uniref:Ldh family oxidoreductase n=1 Tax=Nitratireductor sp. TaxID=1872084 RepID=UPI0025CE3CDC|nr:Ldh family oxidoreductase [Nitratireductor sp.]